MPRTDKAHKQSAQYQSTKEDLRIEPHLVHPVEALLHELAPAEGGERREDEDHERLGDEPRDAHAVAPAVEHVASLRVAVAVRVCARRGSNAGPSVQQEEAARRGQGCG